jgi:hypothetical protein
MLDNYAGAAGCLGAVLVVTGLWYMSSIYTPSREHQIQNQPGNVLEGIIMYKETLQVAITTGRCLVVILEQ